MLLPQSEIQPGDVLLYTLDKRSLFSWAIFIKTGSKLTHAETYIGNGLTVTAMSSHGVNYYPFNPDRLGCIMRPRTPFDLARALEWFEHGDYTRTPIKGQPYGYLDLGTFYGLPYDGPGMVCSAVSTAFGRAGGLSLFNDTDARRISPFALSICDALTCVAKLPGL